MNTLIHKANILVEALPYIQKLSGKTVVIKYGGNAMVDEEITKTIMQDITLLKYVGVNPVVVHGGGPQINETLDLMKIESRFHKGLRVTTEDAIDVVEMVLAGSINKDIVSRLNSLGGKAIGICGKDGNLIQVKKKVSMDNVDLGYVGEIKKVDSKIIEVLASDEYIPVIAPIGTDDKGQSYNINADTAAGEIAAALKAEKLIFLTDIDGIYLDPNDAESLISVISVPEIYELMDKGIITGGMIPKVLACIKGIQQGVNRTHILNGTIPHPILLEIFTHKGIGTMVTKGGC
jgi:acetylglutamate kinase